MILFRVILCATLLCTLWILVAAGADSDTTSDESNAVGVWNYIKETSTGAVKATFNVAHTVGEAATSVWHALGEYNMNRRCPVHSHLVKRIHDHFTKSLFGQELAHEIIIKAFRRHFEMRIDQPLVLHFAGDNGVGKTFATQLIGKGMFRRHDRGIISLRGEQFTGNSSEEIIEHKRVIRNRILRGLKTCHRSLIIMDEAEKPSPQTLAVFKEFMEGLAPVEWEGVEIPLEKTIIIFVSDFGRAGVTLHDTLEELILRVEAETDKVWGREAKLIDLIDEIVPFASLDLEALTAIAKSQLDQIQHPSYFRELRIQSVEYPPELPRLIAKYSMHRYGKRNGRGIKHALNPVVSEILDAVEEYGSERVRRACTRSARGEAQPAHQRLPHFSSVDECYDYFMRITGIGVSEATLDSAAGGWKTGGASSPVQDVFDADMRVLLHVDAKAPDLAVKAEVQAIRIDANSAQNRGNGIRHNEL